MKVATLPDYIVTRAHDVGGQSYTVFLRTIQTCSQTYLFAVGLYCEVSCLFHCADRLQRGTVDQTIHQQTVVTQVVFAHHCTL